MALREVTDPALLKQLGSAPTAAPAAPSNGLKEVTDEAILAQLNAAPAATKAAPAPPEKALGPYASAVVRPLAKGIAGIPLMAMDAGVAVRNLGGMALDKLQGKPVEPGYEMPSAMFNRALDAFTTTPQGLGRVAEGVSSALVGAKALPAPTEVGGGFARAPTVTPPRPQARTTSQLRQAAKTSYDEAQEAGVIIKGDSLTKLHDQVAEALQGQGFDPQLQPATARVLQRLAQTNKGLTLPELENVRRVALAAKESTGANRADGRLVKRIIAQLDDYMGNLGTEDVVSGNAQKATVALKSARNTWRTMRKTEIIDQLMAQAKNKASQYSQSGQENALRTVFRALANNPKRMAVFNAEEQAAIRKVVRGGPAENALRFLGKAAPRGIVSAVLGYHLGGLPLLAAGAGGNLGAKALTQRNAQAVYNAIQSSRSGLGQPLAQAMPNPAIAPAMAGGLAGATAGVGAQPKQYDEVIEE